MSEIWFTADHHFGHKRICQLAGRPFLTVEAMDEELIKNWNDRVAKADTVYHLGDFAFAEHDPYLQRLKGQKRLIIGNHDHSERVKKARGWSTKDQLLHIDVKGQSIALCHYKLQVWNRAHHGALHFYGHSHGNLIGDNQCLDVGVDCWDFRPVNLDEIKARLATQRPRQGVDHHMPKKELFDLTAKIKAETDKAWLLTDGTKEAWVPKSQVEKNSDGTFTMPEWLAKEKEFI